jgi:predicted nucleic acid-binding OB-fold protein
MVAGYTQEELREFDRITLATGSPDQLTRISGRLELNKFVSAHGKDKCDAMFEEIMRREEEGKR